ncbi:hypothetical protein Barb6_03229 [Bacteroidales bacterium Barb6]|nr:hypothetical protein Barb6_03229 [Bacteroidales bacterium Barb6]
MCSVMLFLISKNPKILCRVIQLIPIYMMNNFARSKFSFKFLFCNPAMYKYTTIRKAAIPFFINVSL